jgi:LPXTG-motif cell wall-anchored protein
VEDYNLGAELYSGTAMTKLDTTITYTAEAVGAQVFDGVEFERNTDFVVYATIASGMTAENVGFVVGTLGEDNSKHLLFQWRRNQKDLYVWRQEKKDVWGWSGTADNVINSDIGTNGAEIALVYKNGKYYAFLNGTQVCAIGIAIDNGWGGMLNVSEIIGTEGTLKVGLSVAYGMVQFTNVGFSTDKTEINKYTIDDLPAIGANVYSGGAYAEGLRADGSYRLDAKNGSGAAFFKEVEIQQGQDYVVYTTISNVSGDFVGFAVGTLATPSSFAMIGWRENDIYVVRLADKSGAWGWAGESIVSTIARKAADIALVYKGGEYFFFVNGEQVAYLDKDVINSLAGIGATADTVKVGFAVHWTGATSFSDWGYSTDAYVVGGYEVESPETPVDPEPPVTPDDDGGESAKTGDNMNIMALAGTALAALAAALTAIFRRKKNA